jgi:hypothetical protein
LEQFEDVYVGYRVGGKLDIVKGYATVPLLAPSMPKNTLVIRTCNSKDWSGFTINTDAIISSDTAENPPTAT